MARRWQSNRSVAADGGPIGSLSTLIDLGFVTKLYSQVVHRDLRQTVKTRNAFAHKLGAISFDFPEIKSRANGLKLPDLYPLTNPIEDFTQDTFNDLLGKMSEGNWEAAVTLLANYGYITTDLDSLRDRFIRTVQVLLILINCAKMRGNKASLDSLI